MAGGLLCNTVARDLFLCAGIAGSDGAGSDGTITQFQERRL
jgi:hypothetical protein